MSTNVWGCDYRMCVSEFAFGDYQTRDEQRELLQAYRFGGLKRFHSMNAATLEYTHETWFVSYYTFVLGFTVDATTRNVYMHVNPFVFMQDAYTNSRTTNKQANRWLHERGFKFTIQGLRTVYNNAINGVGSYPMIRVDSSLVLPIFNHTQTYLNADGTRKHERATDTVPRLAYNEDCSALVRVGDNVSIRNMQVIG